MRTADKLTGINMIVKFNCYIVHLNVQTNFSTKILK